MQPDETGQDCEERKERRKVQFGRRESDILTHQYITDLIDRKADRALVLRALFVLLSLIVVALGGWYGGQIFDDSKRQKMEDAIVELRVKDGQLEERMQAVIRDAQKKDSLIYNLLGRWIADRDE